MAAKKTTDTDAPAPEASPHTEVFEQIAANIERASSLAEAENAEGLAELKTETETLISSLPTRGRHDDKSWTETKKDLRAAFTAAATVQEKPAAEVAVKPEPAPVKVYSDYEGVPELVTMGAEKVAEGVQQHTKTSTTAKDIAAIILDMWRRIPNKDGNPDLKGDSDQAKKASGALYAAAGVALKEAGADAFDVDDAQKKLKRAVQTQRTDVRAEYLRSLDIDNEEAAAERARFAEILKNKPEDVPASVWVSNHYGVSLKGEIEKARERYRLALEKGGPQAITSGGGEGEGEGDGEGAEGPSADEQVTALVAKLKADISKARPEAFENASDETKEAARADLEILYKALKDMITATL